MEMETDYKDIPMESIDANDDFNCRGRISALDVADLATDIALRGMIQPITVEVYDDEHRATTGKKYRLLAGFRRYKAHIINDKDMIRAIIRMKMMVEADAKYFNLSENIKRKDLNITQEAYAIKKLHDAGETRQMVGKKLQMSDGWVQVRFMLLDLPIEVQDLASAGFFSQQDIRDLYTILNNDGREKLAEAVRQYKDASRRGDKTTILMKIKRKKLNTKHMRRRPEIFDMMKHLQDTVGNSLVTRALAWCSGEISDLDFYRSVKEYYTSFGRPYSIPSGVEAEEAKKIIAEIK